MIYCLILFVDIYYVPPFPLEIDPLSFRPYLDPHSSDPDPSPTNADLDPGSSVMHFFELF